MNILFANPMMLFGLAAIAIPIIIHLFNFRRYKVAYFSNTRLLQNVTQQTKSKTQLKHLLVLLFRILAIVCLVMAFAQPYIPVTQKQRHSRGGTVVGIYVDNSFSMSGQGSSGQLLEEAKKRADKIIRAYPPGTDFIILSNDDAAESHFVQTRDNAAEFIKTIALSPVGCTLSQANSRFAAIASADAPGKTISSYYISDFQESSSDLDKFTRDSLSETFFITVSPRVPANLFVDSCWFENPVHSLVQPDKIFVAIKNSSDETYPDLSVKYYVNDTVKALSSVSIKPLERKIITLDYNNTAKGFTEGKVEITDYPVAYDNTYYISYNIASSYKVCVISEHGANPFIKTVLASESSIVATFFNNSNIDYAKIKGEDLVIIDGVTELSAGLAQELASFTNEGGSIMVFPSSRSKLDSYNALLQKTGVQLGGMDTSKTKSGSLNYKHPLLRNVFKKEIGNADLPVFFKHFKLSLSSHSSADILLWGESNEPLLITAPAGPGQVFISSSECSDAATNLVKHPLFVPIILKSVFASAASSSFDCKVGSDNLVKLRTTLGHEKMLHLVSSDGKFDVIPGQVAATSESATKLFVGSNVTEAGQYYVVNDKERVANVSFNFNRSDSQLDFYSADEIAAKAKELGLNARVVDKPREFTGEMIKQLDQGIQLWKWFIIAVLAFLLAETLVIRGKNITTLLDYFKK